MKEKLDKKKDISDNCLSFFKQCCALALCLIILDAQMSGKTDVINAIEQNLEIKCK